MKKNLHIVIVSDVVYPYMKGGAERRVHEIGTRLAARGHDVHIFCMQYWKGNPVRHENGITLHGVCKAKPLYAESAGRRSLTQPLVFAWNLGRPLRRELAREPVDVIDCSSFPFFSLFVCRRAADKAHVKLLSTWHEVWGLPFWRKYLGWRGVIGSLVERWASRMPQAFLVPSTKTERKLREVLGATQPCIRSPNGFDPKSIEVAPREGLSCDVIFVGRLIREKGVDLLLRSIALSKKPIKCRILGEGPERARLELLSRELGLSKHVRFEGFLQTSTQVYSAMKKARVLVLPSIKEGFGITVLEANACGIPVITVHHPDNAATELITEGVNGLTCAPNPAALHRAISRALDKRWSKRAVRDAIAPYTWDSIVDSIEEAYR